MKSHDKTAEALEKLLGITIGDLNRMDFDEEKKFVEGKTGKPLTFSKERNSVWSGRGNPNLNRRKICTMEDIDKKIVEM